VDPKFYLEIDTISREQWPTREIRDSTVEIRRRADEGRPDEHTSAIVIREVGFRIEESIAGDWRAISESKSSSRRVTTRNEKSSRRSVSRTCDFFYFDRSVIQLQRPKDQKRSVKSRKKYF
jgi:hypothetical protein